jgi:hypothetical protein
LAFKSHSSDVQQCEKALVVWEATRRSVNRSWDSDFLAIVNVARVIAPVHIILLLRR